MRTPRLAAFFALPLAMLGLAAPASAAPPSNDGYGGRVTVGALPFSVTQDTTEATTDADDAELNATCGAPATDASVWYEVTATTDGALVADVSGSGYSAGVLVGTGGPGSFETVSCGPGATAWDATAGTTYAILVIDDQQDGGGNGGTLALTVDNVPPPPTISVTVNHNARFTKAGDVIVSGTVTCTGQVDFAFLDATVTQRVGRLKITGSGETDVLCDGSVQPWSMTITADNGLFRGGKAASITFATACGVFTCGDGFDQSTIKLSGGK
ncbi:hypothetical protein GCM10022237_11650 [Nocardioides ginsengisoli]|uniref:DUF6299 family protein n=1 Tax=Nocardioides ginsengisoli TaxID=363868 RepID=A0ABW3W8W2_9ACTN